jgi:hypothetical protein
MSANRKGDRRERELVNKLDDAGFAVMRAPASGSATARDLPDGLAGEQIPVESAIVSCCDAFNAMTTDRSYRAAMAPEEPTMWQTQPPGWLRHCRAMLLHRKSSSQNFPGAQLVGVQKSAGSQQPRSLQTAPAGQSTSLAQLGVSPQGRRSICVVSVQAATPPPTSSSSARFKSKRWPKSIP